MATPDGSDAGDSGPGFPGPDRDGRRKDPALGGAAGPPGGGYGVGKPVNITQYRDGFAHAGYAGPYVSFDHPI